MDAFLPQPPRIPLLFRLGIWISERVTGRVMLPARLLAWYPKAAIGSGVLEALVAHDEPGMDRRMLQLIRMAASHAAACPFCIDMNSYEHRQHGITDEEARAVRGEAALETVPSLGVRERLAIQYARLVSQTPLKFHPEIVKRRRAHHVIENGGSLAATAAQVNYWARLIQALGIPPAGFGDA